MDIDIVEWAKKEIDPDIGDLPPDSRWGQLVGSLVDRVLTLENALEECKTTALDMANRTINVWHLTRAICTIVERANGHSNPTDKHD
jgi:hypothetical protein